MEQRRFPRINIKIPAKVTPRGHAPINVLLLDTSCSVLKLECNRVAHEIMSPDGGWRQRGESTELYLEMVLPDGSGDVTAICAVAFSRRVSKDRFHLGLRYSDLSDQDYNRLTRFIDLCSANAPSFQAV